MLEYVPKQDPVFYVLYPVLCILNSVSCILYFVFHILYCVACVLYPISCILYPIMCILYLVSCTLYSGNKHWKAMCALPLSPLSLSVHKRAALHDHHSVWHYVQSLHRHRNNGAKWAWDGIGNSKPKSS